MDEKDCYSSPRDQRRGILRFSLAIFFIVSCCIFAAQPQERTDTPSNAEDLQKNDKDYLLWGAHLKSINPSLSPGEVYDIGRAIVRYSRAYRLPPGLIVAVIKVESSGRLDALSPKGAVGLMQVMPWWPRELGIKGDLYSVDTNIRIGTHILAENIKRWGRKEGILRYYRGGGESDDGYFVKVQRAMDGLAS